MKKSISSFLILTASLFLLFSCATTSVSSRKNPETAEWNVLSDGISEIYGKNGKITYHAVRLDFTASDFEIISPEVTGKMQKRYSVKSFARKNKADLAFNTNPFTQKFKLNPFSKALPVGLVVQNGKKIIPENRRYAALTFEKTEKSWKAAILDSQNQFDENGKTVFASGGFWMIMKNGNILSFKDIKDYRTGAGISDSGKTLYLLYAKNASYMDCAEILKTLGAETAMEFDGGSSASLYLYGKTRIRNPLQVKVPCILGFKEGKLLID